MRQTALLVGLVLLLACAGAEPDDRATPAPKAPLAPTAAPGGGLFDVIIERDLPYVEGTEVDDRQRLDLYLPDGPGPWPTLLWIHGGAWAVGHRNKEEALARRFAERGIAVAAADHRMSRALWIDEKLDQGVQHPEHVRDCAAAFAWLVESAEKWRLAPDRMFVGGFSSGAHLSALLAADPAYLEARGLDAFAIRGALPVAGAYDIEAYYRTHLEHNGEKMAEQHVLDVFGRGEGILFAASPTSYLGKTKVPMLVLSEKMTIDYTKLYEDAVKAAGVEWIRFLPYPDRTHANICSLMAREEPDEARDAMIAFIRDPDAATED